MNYLEPYKDKTEDHKKIIGAYKIALQEIMKELMGEVGPTRAGFLIQQATYRINKEKSSDQVDATIRAKAVALLENIST